MTKRDVIAKSGATKRSRRRGHASVFVLLLALAGCAPGAEPAAPPPAPPPAQAAQQQPYRCILPQERRMLVAELFFGRNIAGRGPLTEAEWRTFAADTITPNFPDGLTVFDGDGQWRNPATGKISHERTKIVLVAAKRVPDLAGRLSAVIDTYKNRFHQQSAGIITRDSCAGF
jgi:hypothetical protein